MVPWENHGQARQATMKHSGGGASRTPVGTIRRVIRADWLLVLLTLGAVTRLTRLVTDDVAFRPFRRFVIRHRPDPPGLRAEEDWLVYLIHCRWCASIWVSAAVAPVVYNWPAAWWVQIPLMALTASLLAGLSGRWE